MLWEICLGISIWLLILPMTIMLCIEVQSSRTGIHAPIFRAGISCMLAALSVNLFPFLLGDAPQNGTTIVKTALLSVLHGLKAFTLGVETEMIQDAIVFCPESLRIGYQICTVVLLLLAPLFTVGFVLSLFRNLSARMQYILAYRREMYVFSELTDKALTLAKDIAHNHPSAAIAFAETLGREDTLPTELLRGANRIGAILFHSDITAVSTLKHSPKKGLWLFAMGEDDNKNLDLALELISSHTERPNTHLYVSALTAESDLLLSAVKKGKVRVRRINEARSMTYHVLEANGTRLFDHAIPTEDGIKEIHAVIVGLGHHGTEILKAMAWYCQMDGYRVHIHAFDRDPLAEEKLTAAAPELLSPKYNGVIIKGEAQYTITIHSGCDTATARFAAAISQIKQASYVLISLGDDDLNTQTAVQLRMLFERAGIHPIIQAILYDSRRKTAMTNITNFRNQPYDIEFVGDLQSSYAENSIIHSSLEEQALQRHLKWGSAADFWNYEYHYRSSMAAALHMQARIHCGIPGAELPEEEMQGEAKIRFEMLEHRRWNAYMRSEGYVYSGSPDANSRNDLAKMHHNLVDYDTLPEADKRKDSKVGLK